MRKNVEKINETVIEFWYSESKPNQQELKRLGCDKLVEVEIEEHWLIENTTIMYCWYLEQRDSAYAIIDYYNKCAPSEWRYSIKSDSQDIKGNCPHCNGTGQIVLLTSIVPCDCCSRNM